MYEKIGHWGPHLSGVEVGWTMCIDGLALVSQPVKFCYSRFNWFCVGMGCSKCGF